MTENAQSAAPKILILGTLSGGYRGADATGQSHQEWPVQLVSFLRQTGMIK